MDCLLKNKQCYVYRIEEDPHENRYLNVKLTFGNVCL